MNIQELEISQEELIKAIDLIQKQKPKITVVGDIILDEYIIAYPERISREAPVLILEYKENFYRLGGAANSAVNASSLGAEVSLVGEIGIDSSARILKEICLKENIKLNAIENKNKFTTLKSRILASNQSKSLANSGNASVQQILRIDKINRDSLNLEYTNKLIEIIKTENSNAILLSDYSLGVLSKEVIESALNSKIKIIVDPSNDFKKFKNCFLMTPNQPDTENEIGLKINTNNINDLKILISKLKEKGGSSNYLITKGSEGMMLVENNKIYLIPAFNKAEVFDVTGAGDTVSACVSVGCACGLNLLTCMILGNLSASIVIRKSGAATTTFEEMKEILNNFKFPIKIQSIEI